MRRGDREEKGERDGARERRKEGVRREKEIDGIHNGVPSRG